MSAAPRLIQRFRARELSKSAGHLNLKQNKTVQLQNPFIPFFNPITKRWAPPTYSRRRQAELIKAAKASNMLHLLPPGPKLELKDFQRLQQAEASSSTSTGVNPSHLSKPTRVQSGFANVKVQWIGEVKEKAVPGADIGARLYAGKKRMFKGHKWERELVKRKAKIGCRMRDMQKRIERFKSHYRRRRPSPLLPATKRKESLPF